MRVCLWADGPLGDLSRGYIWRIIIWRRRHFLPCVSTLIAEEKLAWNDSADGSTERPANCSVSHFSRSAPFWKVSVLAHLPLYVTLITFISHFCSLSTTKWSVHLIKSTWNHFKTCMILWEKNNKNLLHHCNYLKIITVCFYKILFQSFFFKMSCLIQCYLLFLSVS